MNVLLTICGVLSIIMIVILFVYSYFQYSYIIINKSNNIGLLKTLKYSYSQIVLLFVLAPIIITLPICGLGNIISWFVIKALNLYQYKTTMILFNIYQLKSISILCSFVVLIFAILISILIFLRSKYNKSSIYLIREIDK